MRISTFIISIASYSIVTIIVVIAITILYIIGIIAIIVIITMFILLLLFLLLLLLLSLLLFNMSGGITPALLSSPYEEQLNQLRLDSLRIHEKKLLHCKAKQELERIRGPEAYVVGQVVLFVIDYIVTCVLLCL